MLTYFPRNLEPPLAKSLKQFPAVIVTGPRQSGKTSLVKTKLSKTYKYVSLEAPDLRAFAKADPRGFLEKNASPAIIDEIQYVPELLNYIKQIIDDNREQPGQYVLTGSQNFALMHGISQSLAGRAGILELLPLAISENPKTRIKNFDNVNSIASWWITGSYPEIHQKNEIEERAWYNAYLNTYLERDVRQILNVGDINAFNQLIRLLATQTAGILNMSSISTDTGIVVNTVKKWISVLQASYQIFLLQPYYRKLRKRLLRTPKVYFIDCGVLMNLLGFIYPEQALQSVQAGSFFENMIVGELLRIFANSGEKPSLYYWRTTAHEEVDIVIEWGGKIHAIECKFTQTPTPIHAKGLIAFAAEIKKEELGIFKIIYPVETKLTGMVKISENINLMSLSALAEVKTLEDLFK